MVSLDFAMTPVAAGGGRRALFLARRRLVAARENENRFSFSAAETLTTGVKVRAL